MKRPVPRVAPLVLASVLLVVSGARAAPSPTEPIPREPRALAQSLAETSDELATAIDRWRPKSAPAPDDVVLRALYQQRIYRVLAADPKLSRTTLRLLPRAVATVAADLLAAHRELYRLTPPLTTHKIRTGPALPASVLLDAYRAAQRRFKVPWNLLAAVNFVESKFGRLRNASAAGAQGPMQFMPATWRRYGLGGNIHDAHDAILGAANYLHASGAPRDLRGALHHYNPSRSYVDAVLRYARRIASDRTMFFALYNWQVFVKTARGDRRVTGPGLP
jgi:membrane-bound lytic murein transglycosylase B